MWSPVGLRTALAGLAGLIALSLWGASLDADATVVRDGAAQQAGAPDVRVPATAEDWETQAPSVRARLRRQLDLPVTFTPRGRVLSSAARGGWVQQTLQLDDGAGRTVNGKAIIPAGHVGRGPAVLCLADAGAAAGVVPGEELARQGCLVFEFNANDRPLAGGVRDDLLALHYVLNRRDVDPERVAVCGVGQGGTRAIWLAALQPRVAMAVSLCPDHVPSAQLLGLVAPRPQLVLCGAQQPGVPPKQARDAFAAGRQFYRLYDLPELLRAAVLPNAGERPTRRMWEEATAWLVDEL